MNATRLVALSPLHPHSNLPTIICDVSGTCRCYGAAKSCGTVFGGGDLGDRRSRRVVQVFVNDNKYLRRITFVLTTVIRPGIPPGSLVEIVDRLLRLGACRRMTDRLSKPRNVLYPALSCRVRRGSPRPTEIAARDRPPALARVGSSHTRRRVAVALACDGAATSAAGPGSRAAAARGSRARRCRRQPARGRARTHRGGRAGAASGAGPGCRGSGRARHRARRPGHWRSTTSAATLGSRAQAARTSCFSAPQRQP